MRPNIYTLLTRRFKPPGAQESDGQRTVLAKDAQRWFTEVDGVRGVLSLFVLAGHYFGGMNWVWICMDLFFCISGFLITRAILSHSRQSSFLRTYLLRRILRIWPVYFVVLLFTIALGLIAEPINPGYFVFGRGTWQSLLFLQNVEYYSVTPDTAPGPRAGYPFAFDHSWSVALEEQYYLIWPLLVIGISRLTQARRALLALTLALPVISIASRELGIDWWVLLSRLDGFALGGLLAILLFGAKQHEQIGNVRRAFFWGFAISAPFGALAAQNGGMFGVPFVSQSTFAVTTAACLSFLFLGHVVTSSGAPHLWLLRTAFLRHLGRISYSTYLWHMPLLAILAFVFRPYDFSLWIPVATFLTVLGFSHMSYMWIERPFLHLKRRLDYSGQSALTSAAPGSSSSLLPTSTFSKQS